MKPLLLLFTAIYCFTAAGAQGFEVPFYGFREQADYARYDQDVIACVDWLLETPLDEQVLKRQ